MKPTSIDIPAQLGAVMPQRGPLTLDLLHELIPHLVITQACGGGGEWVRASVHMRSVRCSVKHAIDCLPADVLQHAQV